MIQRRCLCCKELFVPRRNIADQRYCGKAQCRRARRAYRQRQKLNEDPDYREYQAKAQKRWREAHPDYMREYRKTHPDYREKERKRSARNRFRKKAAGEQTDMAISSERVVKMDLSGTQRIEKSGYYKLYPLSGNGVVKMDSYLVQLIVVEQVTEDVGSS